MQPILFQSIYMYSTLIREGGRSRWLAHGRPNLNCNTSPTEYFLYIFCDLATQREIRTRVQIVIAEWSRATSLGRTALVRLVTGNRFLFQIR